MDLARLFRRCLAASYLHVEGGADFAAYTAGGVLYLLFQWSRGGEDWQNNLDFPAAPYRDMPHRWYCHRGFLRVWRGAEPYIAQILDATAAENVVIAGYSHGGALAALCHEFVWFHFPARREAIEGYGFGAPRVVWCPFGVRQLAARWARFTVVRNLDDPVTQLPPRVLGYRHMGRMLEIGKSGRYAPIDAHRPENYRDSLEEFEALMDAGVRSRP